MSDFGDTGELVPDLPAPIRAYRAWSTDGTRLMGMGGVIWPAGEPLKARCQSIAHPRGDYHRRSLAMSYSLTGHYEEPTPVIHECPSPNSDDHHGYGCGIYAYRDPSRFVGSRTYVNVDDEGQVIGCVELGGKVYEHEHGYRAEYAMPVAFYGDPTDPALALLASVYDVPIEPPPWEDPEVIRKRVNEQAKTQAEEWDEGLERAKARASAPRPSRPRSAQVAASEGEGDAGPKWPNEAGYSDEEIEHVALLKGHSPSVITACINKNPWLRYDREVKAFRREERKAAPRPKPRWYVGPALSIVFAELLVGTIASISEGRVMAPFFIIAAVAAVIATTGMVRRG